MDLRRPIAPPIGRYESVFENLRHPVSRGNLGIWGFGKLVCTHPCMDCGADSCGIADGAGCRSRSQRLASGSSVPGPAAMSLMSMPSRWSRSAAMARMKRWDEVEPEGQLQVTAGLVGLGVVLQIAAQVELVISPVRGDLDLAEGSGERPADRPHPVCPARPPCRGSRRSGRCWGPGSDGGWSASGSTHRGSPRRRSRRRSGSPASWWGSPTIPRNG